MSETKYNPLAEQIGGTHYKALAIQPAEYCQRNALRHLESSAVKYVTRHRAKGGRQDIEKAIHCLQLLLVMDYPQHPSGSGASPSLRKGADVLELFKIWLNLQSEGELNMMQAAKTLLKTEKQRFHQIRLDFIWEIWSYLQCADSELGNAVPQTPAQDPKASPLALVVDWSEVRAFYEKTGSPKQTAAKFELSINTVKGRVKREGWKSNAQPNGAEVKP